MPQLASYLVYGWSFSECSLQTRTGFSASASYCSIHVACFHFGATVVKEMILAVGVAYFEQFSFWGRYQRLAFVEFTKIE